MPRPSDRWTWHDIKAELGKRGTSFAQLARENGLHQTSIARIRRERAERPQQIVADAVGVHPKELWPERYDSEGNPIDRRRIRTTSGTLKGSHAA